MMIMMTMEKSDGTIILDVKMTVLNNKCALYSLFFFSLTSTPQERLG